MGYYRDVKVCADVHLQNITHYAVADTQFPVRQFERGSFSI